MVFALVRRRRRCLFAGACRGRLQERRHNGEVVFVCRSHGGRIRSELPR